MDVYGHLMPQGGDEVANRLGALVFPSKTVSSKVVAIDELDWTLARIRNLLIYWWPGTESNCRHRDFQSPLQNSGKALNMRMKPDNTCGI